MRFFAEMATQFLDWDQPWSEVCSFDFTRGEASWFAGGRLNVSVNCIDRHLPARADQTPSSGKGTTRRISAISATAELQGSRPPRQRPARARRRPW
jgi:acetyl-CoA synthetase